MVLGYLDSHLERYQSKSIPYTVHENKLPRRSEIEKTNHTHSRRKHGSVCKECLLKKLCLKIQMHKMLINLTTLNIYFLH